MTSDQSQVSLCNIALLATGGKSQISNFQENSPQARACNQLFSYTFVALARAAYWNCLRRQQILTLIQAAQGTPENPQGTTLPLPPPPFLYAYQVPSDSLASRWLVRTPPVQSTNIISPAMMPASTYYGRQNIPFKVATVLDINNKSVPVILTNLRQAQVVYTVNEQNPQNWDGDLQTAFVESLAVFLIKALAMNKALLDTQRGTAQSLIVQARIRDANEGTNSQDHVPDFIQARAACGGYGINGGYGGLDYGGDDCWGGYQNMPW